MIAATPPIPDHLRMALARLSARAGRGHSEAFPAGRPAICIALLPGLPPRWAFVSARPPPRARRPRVDARDTSRSRRLSRLRLASVQGLPASGSVCRPRSEPSTRSRVAAARGRPGPEPARAMTPAVGRAGTSGMFLPQLTRSDSDTAPRRPSVRVPPPEQGRVSLSHTHTHSAAGRAHRTGPRQCQKC